MALTVGSPFAAAQQPPSDDPVETKKPNEEDGYWNTNWALQGVDLQTLTKRLELLGFEIPVDAKGTTSVNFQIGVPTGRLTDTTAYRFRGSLTASDVQLDNLTLQQLFADIIYDNGQWKLTRFDGKTKSGTFAGTASVDTRTDGKFQADLTVKKIQLQPLIELFGKFSGQSDLRTVNGSVDGKINLSGKVEQLQDVTAWTVQGSLTAHNFVVGQSSEYEIDVEQFSLRDQQFHVERLAMSSPDHPDFFLRGSGRIGLDQKQQFDIRVAGNDVPVADLLGLYLRQSETWASGTVDIKGKAVGQLATANSEPPDVEADLMIASPELQVMGLDVGLVEHRVRLSSGSLELLPLFPNAKSPRRKIESIRAKYQISADEITVSEFVGRMLGGSIYGSGTFARSTTETHRINARWQDIAPSGQFALPWMSRRLSVAASTSGTLQWAVPADKIEFPAFHQGTAKVEIDSIQLDGETVGSIKAVLNIEDAKFSLDADGELFDGTIALNSQATIEPAYRWTDVPKIMLGGQLIIRQLSVGDTVQALTESNNRRFAGRLDGTLDFKAGGDNPLQWDSSLTLRDLRVDRKTISTRLDAELAQKDGIIELKSFAGSLGGGTIQASGQWALEPGNRTINVRLSRSRADDLLSPWIESDTQPVEGLVSGRAVVSGSGAGPFDGIRAVGSIRMLGGSIAGLAVGDARSPFRLQLNATPLYWRASLPRISAKFARGSLQGAMKIGSPIVGSGLNLDSRWRMTHVDFQDLLSNFVGTNTIGRGDLTGDLMLSGRRIRSVNDLNGRFRLKLGGTDATAVPGLPSASSALGVLSLSGVRFTSGEATGQITGGALRLENLAMTADRVRVQATGRVFLAGPRLDARVLIETGNFEGQQVLNGRLAPNAIRSLSGTLAPLASANQLLSERTFVLDLYGRLQDPQVRVLAAETIQTNLRRHLIRSAIGLAVGDSILDFD